jgi:hypothetical protein
MFDELSSRLKDEFAAAMRDGESNIFAETKTAHIREGGKFDPAAWVIMPR